MDTGLCLDFVANGIYNPYKQYQADPVSVDIAPQPQYQQATSVTLDSVPPQSLMPPVYAVQQNGY